MLIKISNFTEAQIVFAIKQSEQGVRVDEICRKMGNSEATFYNWKKKQHKKRPDSTIQTAKGYGRTSGGIDDNHIPITIEVCFDDTEFVRHNE